MCGLRSELHVVFVFHLALFVGLFACQQNSEFTIEFLRIALSKNHENLLATLCVVILVRNRQTN